MISAVVLGDFCRDSPSAGELMHRDSGRRAQYLERQLRTLKRLLVLLELKQYGREQAEQARLRVGHAVGGELVDRDANLKQTARLRVSACLLALDRSVVAHVQREVVDLDESG